jgi:oligoribonuclease
MLAFLDLETTGLDVARDDVLEVACLVVDDRLVEEIASYHAVVRTSRELYELPEVVRDMHVKSGLWDDVVDTERALPIAQVDRALSAFLREHAVKIETDGQRTTLVRPQLAGNGIHFDRGFMRRCLRRAEAELHHRQLDVTSVNELMRRFSPAAYETRPRPTQSAHRAMNDVRESLAVARHYGRHLMEAGLSACPPRST